MRENPATVFIAHTLAERIHGKWDETPESVRREWLSRASALVVAMYEAGFTIPQPADPDAIWAELQADRCRPARDWANQTHEHAWVDAATFAEPLAQLCIVCRERRAAPCRAEAPMPPPSPAATPPR